MKKSIVFLMLAFFSLAFSPAMNAATVHDTIAVAKNNPEMPERVKILLNRVDEIKAMDRSKMTRVERKALRKELRAINAELRTTGNGIYLSIGAIIIIILLLILIL